MSNTANAPDANAVTAVLDAARAFVRGATADRHDRSCAVARAAVWGRVADCSCGLQALCYAISMLDASMPPQKSREVLEAFDDPHTGERLYRVVTR